VKDYIHLIPAIEGITGQPECYPYSSAKGSACAFDNIFGYYDKCFSNLEQIAENIVEGYLDKHNLSFNALKHRSNCERRNELVLLVRDSTGYSIRKISQLLDLNRGEVYKILQIDRKEGLR
jgi:hypothetical protein